MANEEQAPLPPPLLSSSNPPSLNGNREEDADAHGPAAANTNNNNNNNWMHTYRSRNNTSGGEEEEEADIYFPSGEISVIAEEENQQHLPPLPQREEPTMKEKLVERERQARVETERARLKRQFALSLSHGGITEGEHSSGGQFDDVHDGKGGGSVAGTMGDESSIDVRGGYGGDDGDGHEHPNHHHHRNGGGGGSSEEKNQNEPLGYAMERFLNDPLMKPPIMGTTKVQQPPGGGEEKMEAPPKDHVVMERFLADPVVVDTHVAIDNGSSSSSIDHNDTDTVPTHEHDHDHTSMEDGDDKPEPMARGGGDVERNTNGCVVAESATTESNMDILLGRAGTTTGLSSRERTSSDPRVYSDIGATQGSIRSYSTHDHDLSYIDPQDEEVLPEGLGAGVGVGVGVDSIMAMALGGRTQLEQENGRLFVPPLADPPVEVQLIDNAGGISLPSLETDDDDHTDNRNSGQHNIQRLRSSSESNRSTSSDTPPRVFRLTAREIQEMAAIEEASIGNAPPSERNETFSEDGDMVGELGGEMGSVGHADIMDHHGAFSEATQTTILESSTTADYPSMGDDLDRQESLEQNVTEHSLDQYVSASVSSHIHLSLGGSDSDDGESVAAMPPSENGEGGNNHEDDDDDHHHHDPHGDSIQQDGGLHRADMQLHDQESAPNGRARLVVPTNVIHTNTSVTDNSGLLLDAATSAAANSGVVNRKIRPGMMNDGHTPLQIGESERVVTSIEPINNDSVFRSGMQQSMSSPALIVDGFDFDKYNQNPLSPRSPTNDSLRDLPGDDIWSPLSKGGGLPMSPLTPLRPLEKIDDREPLGKEARFWSPPGTISVSPLRKSGDDSKPPAVDHCALLALPNDRQDASHKNYGSSSDCNAANQKRQIAESHLSVACGSKESGNDEHQSLLNNESRETKVATRHSRLDIILGCLVDAVPSDEPPVIAVQKTESACYVGTNSFKRAIPERLVALCVTLLIEIPVFLIIAGGSEQLCGLIGRRRYQLMVALLPLSCAISGSAGLQASNLTKRAISHGQVTRESFTKWIQTEILAALFLGLGVGVLIGYVAYNASGNDSTFGITIFIAQVISVLTAGITGTLAPLFSSYLFRHRDACKWAGIIETTAQDIVGSFVMIILSYKLLLWFGPMIVEPNDMCGVV